jgi:hypothetical protein
LPSSLLLQEIAIHSLGGSRKNQHQLDLSLKEFPYVLNRVKYVFLAKKYPNYTHKVSIWTLFFLERTLGSSALAPAIWGAKPIR